MLNLRDTMDQMITQTGESVLELSNKNEILLVFLRHFGCTFCREALEELSMIKKEISESKVQLVMVHMSTEELAFKYFQKYGLLEIQRVGDPECKFYKEFGLIKGTFNQLFGFRSWFRGIEAGLIKGYGFGMQLGDGFQMPGVFLISKGKILSEFRHKFPSDKPDYLKMVNCQSAHTKP
ncbi:MAG: AhpC/TSA family protein [Saprospiraceae bacterium]|nr:AhpC/TSA family protein [Saprospiraceae bacterium]